MTDEELDGLLLVHGFASENLSELDNLTYDREGPKPTDEEYEQSGLDLEFAHTAFWCHNVIYS